MAHGEGKQRSSIHRDGDMGDKRIIVRSHKGAAADGEKISSSVATKEPPNQATKECRNQATKQRQTEATKEPQIETTEKRRNQGSKDLRNQGSKERRNQGTKERRNQAAKECQNQGTKERHIQDTKKHLNQGAREPQIEITKDRWNQAAEKRRNQDTEERRNQGTKEHPNQGAKDRRNQATKEHPNQGANERRNQATKGRQNQGGKECQNRATTGRLNRGTAVNIPFLQEDDSDYPRSTTHPCHPDHELLRKNDEKRYTCNGCKMPGFGRRYSCKQCSFKVNLHEKCTFSREDNSAAHHYLLGKSNFNFFYKLPRRCKGGRCRWCHRFCEACAKPTEGFVYYCKDNNTCFHPRCFSLGRKYSSEDECKVELELCQNQTFSKCFLCQKKQIEGSETGNEGWTYVSKCKKFTFHVFCSMNLMVENTNVSLATKNEKLRRGKKRNDIFEIACWCLEILLGALLGDVISCTIGLVQLLKAIATKEGNFLNFS